MKNKLECPKLRVYNRTVSIQTLPLQIKHCHILVLFLFIIKSFNIADMTFEVLFGMSSKKS